MRQLKLKIVFAWLAVLSIAMTGAALAQPTMPSLVTQQQRLSTGGVSPGYVQLRPKVGVTGIGTYFWDQAPTPTANTNYSMWLDAGNNIETSASFGPVVGAAGTGAPFYLYRVNATGNGLEWVKPSALVVANNGLSVDSTTTPGVDIVQFGGPSTSPSALLNSRFIDQAGFAVNFTGAANSAMNIGSGNIYNFTLDVGTAAGGNMTLKNLLANTADTTFLTLDNSGNVKTRGLSTLVAADNGLSINPVGGFVELGGSLIKATNVDLNAFNLGFINGSATTPTTLTLGNGTNVFNVSVDPGATGNITLKNILANTADTNILTLDNAGNVKTRGISTLVSAENGLSIDGANGAVEMGGTLLHATSIAQATFGLSYANGSSTFGDGATAYNLNVDVGTGVGAGNINLKNLLANTADTTFLTLDNSGNVKTRGLSTLVAADNGLSINPVGGFVELGGPLATPSALLNSRYIDQAGFAVNFTGAANSAMNIGSGNVYNFTLDVGTAAGGNMTLKNILANNADTNILTLDASGNVKTRGISTLVAADNGLTVNGLNGDVELGAAATGGANLNRTSIVSLNSNTLTFDGTGNFNIGDATHNQNIAMDPGATGSLEIHHLLPTSIATKLMVIGGPNDSVYTRDLSTLVVADNGLTVNNVGGFVELGSAVTGGAPLLRNSVVTMQTGGKNMTFDGVGDFTVGDGTSNENITLNPSATGSTNLKSLAPITPAANNRFVVLDATDKAFTRTLNSFVLANQGVTIDSTTTPGISTVQLGDVTDGLSQISTNRFIQFTGATPSLTLDGTGTFAIGAAAGGNLEFDINTKASNMTIQGANLDNANINNFAWIDSTTNVVHRATTAALVRDNTVADFVGISSTGQIVRSISPTAGIYRGHVAWTAWNQTVVLPLTDNIQPGATVTVTIENHASQGTVPVQVVSVTTGLGTSAFQIEASDDQTAGSFINYIVMNP